MSEHPVDIGYFPEGVQWVLWRPGLDRRRLRRQAMWESVSVHPIPFTLIGLGIILFNPGPIPVGWEWLVAEAVVLGLAGVWARVDYLCWGHDLRATVWRSWRVDRGNGDLFYRREDLAVSGTALVLADHLVQALRDLHSEPAQTWLEVEHLEAAHRVAWQALESLRQTGPLRHAIQATAVSSPHPAVVTAHKVRVDQIEHEVARVGASLRSATHQVQRLTAALQQNIDVPATGHDATAHPLCEISPGLPVSTVSSAAQTAQAVSIRVTAALEVLTAHPCQASEPS